MLTLEDWFTDSEYGPRDEVEQTSEEITPSVCPILPEPLKDYRDIPASIAASAPETNQTREA